MIPDSRKGLAMAQERGKWGSRTGFILAAAGSAVGLGNIWKFPYITGENGGGLFVLIYLVCIAVVGLPIMAAEIMIGRAAQKQPVGAFSTLQGRQTGWSAIGWLGVITGFIILSYYVVVAGWAIDYTLKSVVNFSSEIKEESVLEAKHYRATASDDEMIETLAEEFGPRHAKNEVASIRNEVKPSVWKDHGVVASTIARVQEADATGDSESAAVTLAKQRLFEDSDLQANYLLGQALLERIDATTNDHIDRERTRLRALPKDQLHSEAEDLHRRGAIADRVGARFGGLLADGWTSTFWAALFMMITILIVAGGIASGIERACKVLMPTLMVLIFIMVGYGFFQPGFGEAFSFVFSPDASKLKASGVLEALGHAFFTLSLGMGAMITYGSYQASKEGLVTQSVLIVVFDTAIALLACMMMFPILFSYGQEAGAGPGLVFMSMPLAFAEIGAGGMMLAIFFFGLLVFAALTSSMSLLEVVCSYFIDQRGWARPKAAWLIGGLVFLFGLPVAFGHSDSFILASWNEGFGLSYLDTVDYLASNWLLPLGGLFVAIYAGWIMPARFREQEFVGAGPMLIQGWLLLIRYVAPIMVVAVLLQKVGILEIEEWFG
ncbi:MAG: sodium-dependent transporter [Planctomycetota bacterium]